MSNESKIKKFFKSIKEKKHIEIIIAVIAVVIMLVLYFSTKLPATKKEKTPSVAASNYCEKMEQELIGTLEAMKGVGKVKAVISWESGVETVIAYATSNSGGNITTTPIIITSQGSSSPIVLKELYPKALGVIVICQGGDSVAVKLDIMNAVSAFLDISQNKVNVYAMK